MHDQEQFLDVLDRDEAERRFRAAIDMRPRGVESVPLDAALGRVLAADVVSPVNVPSFDRADVDGFAVVAADTFGASEEIPRPLRSRDEVIHTGVVPATALRRGDAVAIATGGMIPRGADAVVMVEHTDARDHVVWVSRAVTPGAHVSFAGTDIAAGETVLRRGEVLTSRDTGVLAAMGIASAGVWRRPTVAILSTGDEIIAPGQPAGPARVFDSNAQVLADAVRELGAVPIRLGIASDDAEVLHERLDEALRRADLVLLSGGTSKGAGDVSSRVVATLRNPGVVAHGVALKPGKPICLAATSGQAVVVLPGFPTSAMFTFHEFVAPVLRAMSGRSDDARTVVRARLPVTINSQIGRTEYLLVGLVGRSDGDGPALSAYPMTGGSGSVTTFSRADGIVSIGRHDEILPAGTVVDVQLLGRERQLADLVAIGSHCIGLDFLLGALHERGVRSKFLAVGSSAGLDALARGECDVAGIHLLDEATGEYNRPFLTTDLDLIEGYRRLQGVAFRKGDARFEGRAGDEAVAEVRDDSGCVMVNRNRGSGTRVLIERLLDGARPPGHAVQPRNHHAVAAAVAQGRADWGVTLDSVAAHAGLGFLPIQEERYDFAVARRRLQQPAVQAFVQLLQEPETRAALERLGMRSAMRPA